MTSSCSMGLDFLLFLDAIFISLSSYVNDSFSFSPPSLPPLAIYSFFLIWSFWYSALWMCIAIFILFHCCLPVYCMNISPFISFMVSAHSCVFSPPSPLFFSVKNNASVSILGHSSWCVCAKIPLRNGAAESQTVHMFHFIM